MRTINNGFEIGEKCWTACKKKTQYICPVCEGKGHFTYNGYEIQCRNCNATGNIVNQKQSVLDVCKAVVDRIDVAFYSDGSDKIKYRVHALGENTKEINMPT